MKNIWLLGAVVVVGLAVAIAWAAPSFPGAPRLSGGPQGAVHGEVLVGPICPVEHIPPLPQCAPRPYQGAVLVFPAAGGASVATLATNASGTFSASLPAGNYLLRVATESVFPRCEDTAANVVAGQDLSVTISCDTGIR